MQFTAFVGDRFSYHSYPSSPFFVTLTKIYFGNVIKGQCHWKFYHFRTKRTYNTFIYLQNNITTLRERNLPSFERGTSYGLFLPILEAKLREIFREPEASFLNN